jgi:FAD/FMN-containing dehydrogenase
MAQLPTLPPLSTADGLLFRPGDAQFANYQTSFNTRTSLTPELRALCKTANAASTMVTWCRDNSLPFALRCGGHSYEGFSQSSSVVIDTRLMNAISIDPATNIATVGAGASLGDVYRTIAPAGLAFPGGSCPTVGVSGHALGGGYGYLARPFGLACDHIVSIDLVDPQGRQVRADAQQNTDLFWACRGGGGGSFGVAVSFRLQLLKLANVLTFNVGPPVQNVERAAAVMKEWQAWAPQAPRTIDSNLVITRVSNGELSLRCSGMSTGTSDELQRELRALSAPYTINPMTFMQAVNHFSGGWTYPTRTMKGKSDYANAPLSDAGLSTLMNRVSSSSGIYVICDTYGGAISDTAVNATAFAHRAGTLYCMQYGSEWTSPSDTPQRLNEMRNFYAAMRPYVSGSAYVNYCDLDLTDWQNAYWGPNLARLKQIKSAFDPSNVFRHAQSIPLA